VKLDENKLRKLFEEWFEADAMPCEADWFKRDAQFPDMYKESTVEHSWDGFKAGWALGWTCAVAIKEKKK
jgi:hypothetical protein